MRIEAFGKEVVGTAASCGICEREPIKQEASESGTVQILKEKKSSRCMSGGYSLQKPIEAAAQLNGPQFEGFTVSAPPASKTVQPRRDGSNGK